jgi:hypothetical protein
MLRIKQIVPWFQFLVSFVLVFLARYLSPSAANQEIEIGTLRRLHHVLHMHLLIPARKVVCPTLCTGEIVSVAQRWPKTNIYRGSKQPGPIMGAPRL